MEHPVIEVSGDLRLRPSALADLGTLRTFFADPGFNEQWGGQPLDDHEITAKYTGGRSPTVECFMVERRNVPVGLIQYCAAEDGGEGGGIDLVLTPSVRGKGVGTAIALALVDFLQNKRRRTRITVDPDVANPDGVRFWTTAGFVVQAKVDTDLEREPYWLMAWPTD